MVAAYQRVLDLQIPDMLLEITGESLALVVQSLIDPKFFFEPFTFLCTPGNGNNFGTLNLGNLTDDGADSSSSTRYDHSFASFDFPNIEETLVI